MSFYFTSTNNNGARHEQRTSKATRTGDRILNVWIDDIYDRMVTAASIGKHSTLKTKDRPPTTTEKEGGQYVKIQEQSNRLLFVCQAFYAPLEEAFLISIVKPASDPLA